MSIPAANGRGIGVLMILQLAAGLILSFVLMDAVRVGYPSFLEAAAASGVSIRSGIVIATLGAALTIALGIALFPHLRQYSPRAAIVLMAACVISAALDLVHNGTVLSMLSASEQYAAAGGAATANAPLFNAWGIAAASARRSAHIMQLVGAFGWIVTLYFSLFRCRLIPRPLAALGIVGIVSQFVGVTVMMFLGNSPLTYLAAPLAPIHVLAAGWMIFRGIPQARDDA